jgi:hypothetical protein
MQSLPVLPMPAFTCKQPVVTNLTSPLYCHPLEYRNITCYATTAAAMDRRQFMPRYAPDQVAQPSSGGTEPANTLRLRAPRAPLRTAPPIVPPRNPKRLGITPRSPEKVAKIWDPTLSEYVPRLPSGGFACIRETPASRTAGSLQCSISTNTFQQTPLLISASDHGRSLHEEIKSLRQSYIDSQNDDVFAPTTPPRCSASASSLRPPVRNFSLPTYSPPTKPRLRRVRSRSVNLGPVAEASELPDLPFRRESTKSIATNRCSVDQHESQHVPSEVSESTVTTATQMVMEKTTQTAALETKPEGACNCCGSNRKALAMNPTCCIDRTEMGRVCFRCWSSLLAEGLSKQERKDWLCCLICGKELRLSDAKRLASRGTILK